jgi:hypothetical protein
MKKRLPVIIGLIIVILFSIWYGFTDRTHKIYDNNVNTAQYSAIGIIQEGGSVSQSFVCEEDVINGFYIKCDPSGDCAQTVVEIQIIDTDTGEVISTGSDTGNNIRERQLHRFEVDPITGYKGKTLTLVLTEQGSTETSGVIVYYQPSSESIGNFSVNGNETNGVFIMKTITECFDAETFIIVFISIMFIWVFMWFLYRLFK